LLLYNGLSKNVIPLIWLLFPGSRNKYIVHYIVVLIIVWRW